MWSIETIQRLPSKHFRLLANERRMLWVNILGAAMAVALTLAMQRQIVWTPFAIGFAATLGLAAVGAYARETKSSPRIALALVGFAIYAGFTAVSMVFIFALLPLDRPLIDPTLIAIDGKLGYHWPALVSWFADHPLLARALAIVYLSSQQQLIFTILLLSGLSRELQLHRFLAVGIIILIIAATIWWAIPSVGPSAFSTVPEQDIIATNLHFTPAFGEVLRSLIQHGPAEINPEVITGIIAFPSYHIIMASMVVFFTRGTPAFIPPALLNSAMIPAVLVQGGHHLVDLIGGLAVFALGVWVASRVIRDPQSA